SGDARKRARARARDAAFVGVREGDIRQSSARAVRLLRRPRVHEQLLRSLRQGMAAHVDEGCTDGRPGRACQPAWHDEAEERCAAGDLQRTSALLLLGRYARQDHVPARQHARRGLVRRQGQWDPKLCQVQDAHVTPEPLSTPAGRRPLAVDGGTDVELLRATAAGSEPAFEELRRRYGRAVDRVCRSIARSDREDCAQEIFARVWRKASLFDPSRGSAAAWLLTLARNTAINFQSARPKPAETSPDTRAVDPPDVEAFWLDAALERLPERERTVIELAYYDDMTESAIAAELRVALGSVKSWKRRGLN